MTPYHRRKPSSLPGDASYRISALTAVALFLLSTSHAFVPSEHRSRQVLPCHQSSIRPTALCMARIGGDRDGGRGKNNDDDNALNEWIRRKESDDLKRYREQFSEDRLPISYGAMNLDEDDDEEDDEKATSSMGQFGPLADSRSLGDAENTSPSSALARSSSGANKPARVNPYLNVVSRLTPSDLISRFTATASPRVQDAVRTTILGLIGGLPQMAFETKTVATGERLASLMFQLQMTGSSEKEWRDGVAGITGKIKVRYGGASDASQEALTNTSTIAEPSPASSNSSPGIEIEVDAENYMAELRTEVSRLRDELDAKKQEKEEEIRKDLLLYIRTLPPKELKELTSTMSPEVLDAMKGLVTAVLAGIGGKEEDGVPTGVGPNTVTEQSGEALAELCMWQLVVGFNLRELEVREEFKASLKGALGDGSKSSDNEDEDRDEQFPGAFE
ncbi:hypothetical protein HJC23_006795 [Cyclotella cryptica]|uniref:Uncharacterized protein n=1 Tax=Cyclotella cryptica TaxID=29204 RepID=A0ABD3PEM5_9STRA